MVPRLRDRLERAVPLLLATLRRGRRQLGRAASAMPVPGHAPAALDPDPDADAWPCLVTVTVAGHRWTAADVVTDREPVTVWLGFGPPSAPATGTLSWSPLPFPGLPCISLRYGGTGFWLVRRCPALPHGIALSPLEQLACALLPDSTVGCSRGAWPPACTQPGLGRREGMATVRVWVRAQELDR